MKKITLILSVISLLFAFAACSKDNQTDKVADSERKEQTTLQSLGFEDYRNESAKCNFSGEDYWISISKPEWGENPHTGEVNAVTFYQSIHGNNLFVFYRPDEHVYSIHIEYGDLQANYQYNEMTDSYSDQMGGNDLSQAKQIAESVFNKPGTDSILQDAWVLCDQTVREKFDMSSDELFGLSYE